MRKELEEFIVGNNIVYRLGKYDLKKKGVENI